MLEALKHLQNPSEKNCSTIVSYLVMYSQKYSFQMIGFEVSFTGPKNGFTHVCKLSKCIPNLEHDI